MPLLSVTLISKSTPETIFPRALETELAARDVGSEEAIEASLGPPYLCLFFPWLLYDFFFFRPPKLVTVVALLVVPARVMERGGECECECECE